MGEQKRRQQADRAILIRNPTCCYCGAPSAEADHVPPRCFFERSTAPEGYVFPSCVACNRLTRHDEQALAVLMPMNLREPEGDDVARMRKVIQGVKNNSPDLAKEWAMINRPVAQKRIFRERFGHDGNELRRAGYGAVAAGPLTHQAIDRFMLKFGHALFFKHNKRRLVGAVDVLLAEISEKNQTLISGLASIAPEIPEISRNGRSLTHRFDYRFNHLEEHGLLWVVAYFGGQLVVTISAAENDKLETIDQNDGSNSGESPWRRLPSTLFNQGRLSAAGDT